MYGATDETGKRSEPLLNIIGQRVALGPLRRDLVPLYAKWRNDFVVQRTFGNPPIPVTEEQGVKAFEDQTRGEDAHWFTIYDRETLRPIGSTDLYDINYRYRVASFGIQIGEADARGRGLGTEAVTLMLDFAFTALALNNVMLMVSEYNLAGRRAYEKAGFREFGRRRQADSIGGQVYDEIYMDVLAAEFTSPVLGRIFVGDQPRS